MAVDVERGAPSASCGEYVERTFRQVAEPEGPRLRRRAATERCRASIQTDAQAAAAGAQEPALQRLQVHRARRGRAAHASAPPSGWSPDHESLNAPTRSSPSRSPTPASASRRTSSRSSSRRSSRPTAPPAASTAAPGSASRSAARSPACSAARSGSRARRARAARSRSTCRAIYPAQHAGRTDAARTTPAPGAAPRPPTTSARGRGRRRPARARAARRSIEPLDRATTAADIQPGDRVLLIVEDDADFAAILLDLAREHGFKGLVALAGRQGAGAGARVPARRHHPRHPAARHRRLDGAGPAQARPAHPPHPRAHHLGRRGLAARPAARAPSTS